VRAIDGAFGTGDRSGPAGKAHLASIPRFW
jgi:hypothetical protein